MPATKQQTVDLTELPTDNTRLRWQNNGASKLSTSNVVARAHVQLPVDEMCNLLFSPQSSFVVGSDPPRDTTN